MSPAQTQYYWRLFSDARKAQPGLDRKALHAELGLPESSTAFKQEHFDKWKSRCLAIAHPENYRDQAATEVMPRTRRVWLAETLCRALDKEPEYAVATLHRMNRRGAMRAGEINAAELALEDLTEPQLDAVLTALRKACRREWPTKDDAIGAIYKLSCEHGLDDASVLATSAEALHETQVYSLQDLHYDKLLIVFAALRHVVDQPF